MVQLLHMDTSLVPLWKQNQVIQNFKIQEEIQMRSILKHIFISDKTQRMMINLISPVLHSMAFSGFPVF